MESVTALYAGLTGVLFAGLSLNVSLMRGKHKTALGDNSHPDVMRAVRAQGNCAEYIAWLFLMVFLAEASGGGSAILHTLGGVIFAARVLHAFGMLAKVGAASYAGASLNYVALFVSSGYVLYLRFT
jgi:hypothetical protein